MSELAVLWKFFSFGLGAGLLLAVVCAAMGVLVVTRRVAFVGITLSEVAGCGLALGLLILHWLEGSRPEQAETWSGALTTLSAVAATAVAVTFLALAAGARRISQDAVMGIIFVLAGAAGILMVSHSSFGLEEIQELLWGNLLVAKQGDLMLTMAVLLPILAALLIFLPRLLLVFTDADLARLMGLRARLWELAFFYALGVVVAVGSKVGGSLLVFAYLIAPSSAGLICAGRVGSAMALAAAVAAVCTLAGLYLSVRFDMPASQTVIVLLALSPAAAALYSRAAALLK